MKFIRAPRRGCTCPSWLPRLILLAVATGLPVAVAFSGVYTVVTGLTDTTHYFAAARGILGASSRAEWLEAVFRWAPGWPLLVAAVLRFGDSAYVYFLPPLLTWGTMFTLGLSAWALTRRFPAGMLVALTASHFLLFGHAQSPYYLLYPFREPLSFMAMGFAWAAVVLGCRTQGARRHALLFLSGLASVLSAGVREPAIFSLIGLTGYVFLSPGAARRTRMAGTATILSPVLLAVAVLAGYFVMTGRFGTAQFNGWQSMTGSRTWGEWRGMFVQYVSLLGGMLGVSGSILLGLGAAVSVWKFRAVAFLLLVPALATLAFYATFAVYPRYALSVAIYLAPLSGVGCAVAGHAVCLLVRRFRPLDIRPVHAGLALVSLLLSVRQGSALIPWGNTTIRDLRQVEALLQPCLKTGDRIVIDLRHRPLFDLLVSHMGLFPEGAELQPYHLEQRRRIFFEPLSEIGQTHAKVLTPPVSMREVITRWQDLLPMLDPSDRPLTFTLGEATYALRELRPWSAHRIEETVYPKDVVGGLVWFDFRAAASTTERRILWRTPAGETLRNGVLPGTPELAACAAGTLLDGHAAVQVVIESTDPLPLEIVVRGNAGSKAGGFGFGPGRRLSPMAWLADPVIRSQEKWGAVFEDEAAFRIPNPVGADDRVLSVVFEYQVRFPAPGNARFRYEDATGLLEEISSPFGRRILHTVRIPPPRRVGPVLPLRLDVDTPVPFNNHFRLISIQTRLE